MRPAQTPGPAPRAFSFQALSFMTVFLLIFSGIWFFGGALMTTVFLAVDEPFWNDWILDARGVAADATPLSVNQTSSSVNGARVYELQLRVATPGGDETLALGTTDRARIAAGERGEPLRVVYDPSSPRRARFEGTDASIFGLAVLLPGFFAFAGGLGLLLSLRSLLRARNIYVNGEPAHATVTHVASTDMHRNRMQVYRVEYTFHALPGGAARGHFDTVEPPPVETRLWVLYLPGAPHRNLVYPG